MHSPLYATDLLFQAFHAEKVHQERHSSAGRSPQLTQAALCVTVKVTAENLRSSVGD